MRARDYVFPVDSPRQKPLLGTQLDPAVAAELGIVALWTCAEGGGKLTYDLTGRYNATLSGTNASPWVPDNSFMGPALGNNGTTGFFQNLNAPVSGSPCTLLCWSQALVGNNGSIRPALAVADAAGNNEFLLGWTGTTGIPALANRTGGGGTNIQAGTALGVGVWAQLACVFVSTTLRYLFVNGRLIVTDTTSVADPVGLNRVWLGGSASASFLNTSLAMICNRAVTPANVLSLYLNPFAMMRRPMQAWVRSTPIRGYFISPWPNYEDLSLTEDL